MSDQRYNLRSTPKKQRIPTMSNITSSLDTIPNVVNPDSITSSSSSTTETTTAPTAADLHLILDHLKALRDLVETNQANTNRLQLQVEALNQQSQELVEEAPVQRPETIGNDPVETEVDRLRSENLELISRYAAVRTPSPERTHDRYPKVGDPPFFTGKKEELPGYLASLHVLFNMQPGLFRTDRQKILHAFSFTKGSVRNALVPVVSSEAVWDSTNWTQSFSAFSDYLQRNYGNPNKKQTAINKLQALKQTGSASNYFSLFMEYSCILPWTDEIKVSQARRGLDEKLLEYLVMAPDQYDDDFESFKTQAIRIDERMTSNSIERNDRKRREPVPRSYSTPVPAEPSLNIRPNYSRPVIANIRSTPVPFTANPTRRPIPIRPGDPPIDWEVENVKISDKERQWRRDNNRCLICRSPEHQVAGCPSRKERTVENDCSVRGTAPMEQEKD